LFTEYYLEGRSTDQVARPTAQEEQTMKAPTMFETRTVAADTSSLSAYMPVPGFGVLPVNAFVIHAAEPVLIDTGLAALGSDFMQQLHASIDPGDLRWIWITHTDPDHLGNLADVLNEAPDARVVTTYLGMGKMGMHGLPLDRMYLLNPGQTLNVGDRQLAAVSPPTFDAPETTAVFDGRTRTLFSADCFGALLDEPSHSAAEIAPETLREGCVRWASVDAPWLRLLDRVKFTRRLEVLHGLNAETILSAHLPPAKAMMPTLIDHLVAALDAPQFVGPDQQALEQMMAA
jgi:hypothetical protein